MPGQCCERANNFTWKANEIFNTALRHINEGLTPGTHTHTGTHILTHWHPDRAIHLRQSSLAATEAAAAPANELGYPHSEWMNASIQRRPTSFTCGSQASPWSHNQPENRNRDRGWSTPNLVSVFGFGMAKNICRAGFCLLLGDNWKSNKGRSVFTPLPGGSLRSSALVAILI